MLVGRGRRRRGGRGFLAARIALAQQLLDAADRIAFLVQKAVDALGQSDVVGPIVAAVAGALQRLQLREARLPIAQYVLGHAEIGGKLTDRPEGEVALALRFGGHLGQPARAIRSRMIWLAREVRTRRGASGTSTPGFRL